MRFVNAIKERWRSTGPPTAAGVLTFIGILVVSVLGATFVGFDLLASWKASAEEDQTLAASNASQAPWTFAAPTSTLLRFQAKEKVAQNGKDRVKEVLLVSDWKYTQATAAQFEQVRNLLSWYELVSDVTFMQNGMDAANVQMWMQFQPGFNQLFNILQPGANPPATLAPFEQLRNLLFLYEFITNISLLQNNLDAENFMNFIQFELAFNQLFNALQPQPAAPVSQSN